MNSIFSPHPLIRKLTQRSSYLSPFQFLLHPHSNPPAYNHTIHSLKPIQPTHLLTIPLNPKSLFIHCYTSTTEPVRNFSNEIVQTIMHENVQTIMNILTGMQDNGVDVKDSLEKCNVVVTPELVVEVLSRVRNDWEVAFMFFTWAGKYDGYTHSLRGFNSIIGILGKMRKFDIAWLLIKEWKNLVTVHTLVIMMRRYCAVHDVEKAVEVFRRMKMFKFEVGVDEFQGLLSAMCRYKNIVEAENFLLGNENGDVFLLDTKSFNIVLDGWCNVVGSLRESRRFWMVMKKRGIEFDVFSYTSMISLYSKFRKVDDVRNTFYKMKEAGVVPDCKVYNAVIHALGQGRLFKEAFNLLKNMEENGLRPNIVSYNSLIKTLGIARHTSEARKVFHEMLQRGINPSIQTCHSLFDILQNGHHVFEILESMRKSAGCHPTNDTYVLLIKKFCRWRQHEKIFKLWNQMIEDGLSPDRNSYTVIIRGLFFSGKVEVGYKYYKEMKLKGFIPEKKADDIFQAWLSGHENEDPCNSGQENDKVHINHLRIKTADRVNKGFYNKHEWNMLTRERGFSFRVYP